MKAIMIRRPGWGVDFGKAVNHLSEKIKSFNVKRVPLKVGGLTHLINWGFQDINMEGVEVLNTRESVSLVSNKSKFRKKCMEEDEGIVPKTWFNLDSFCKDSHPEEEFAHDWWPGGEAIVRPCRHKQGEHLYFVTTDEELTDAARKCGQGYYISEYIPKVAEYRVYIVDGRVFAVNQKIVEDPEAVAWNHAGGECEFVNVRWDNWPLSACDVATRAFNLSGLDFGGVDVMVDADGRAYVLEINSAISLPFLEDGEEIDDRISYNQKAMIKCLEWKIDGKDSTYDYKGRKENSYHHYIHAAMKEKHDVQEG